MEKFESDKELVAACLECKPKAQWVLYNRYIQAMYNTVYRYTCNHQDTQDILQNGFTRVFKHLKKYDEDKGDLLAWIRKIHIRCALDFLKKRQVFSEEIRDQLSLPNIPPHAWEKLEAEYILNFIEELNPRDRVIFNMRHIEGYSHEEISELLSININSSRVYLARAKKILRERITAYKARLSIVQ
ncbi:MAG: sigma-70 family RNA polymerase sigma factor [Bacteroidota bacterium]